MNGGNVKKKKKKEKERTFLIIESKTQSVCGAAHRLGESDTGHSSVKHSHPDHMECVETHRIPNTDVRGKQLKKKV